MFLNQKLVSVNYPTDFKILKLWRLFLFSDTTCSILDTENTVLQMNFIKLEDNQTFHWQKRII